ncbi:hypothetical protein CAI21_05670 [Alkalilimnicola ehrlichii]|uniref:Lipoprotein n=1 Tax=Alkalilimnicola ehrlichii TaxID=351052 RepID=A0A3E0X0Y2_9GAMM|nr:YajG family lipoprotein [Alkalilimnicola ehrlichii]RFA30534.1 hypothetical protein CAI21_05670 [Alkalilimnicola ehrlichii]RFA38081.1 hypothetical protein CAL65_07040 [Alkalilimnicola ehrlichii]
MPIALRLFAVLCVASLLGACATQSHQISIQPEPEVSASSVGQGRSVGLVVRDMRERADFGTPREADDSDAIIFTEDDVAQALLAGLDQGFQAKGFQPQARNELGRLGVEVRLLTLERRMEDRHMLAEAALEVVAVNEAAKPGSRYRSQYRARQGERRPLDSAAVSERVINGALNQVLTRLLEDEQLLEFLAQ